MGHLQNLVLIRRKIATLRRAFVHLPVDVVREGRLFSSSPLSLSGYCVRKVLEELGPLYIKAGQILSVRHDLLPDAVTAELEQLQDGVPHLPWSEIKKRIEKSLGRKMMRIQEVCPEPLASGSLCQVHEATIKNGKPQRVILKILKPKAEVDVREELRFLDTLLANRDLFLGAISLRAVFEAMRVGLLAHLDLRKEAKHAQQFAENFRHDPAIHFPRVFPEVSSGKVLALEYLDGVKLSRYEEVGADPKALSTLGLQSIFQMVFRDGFVHADLHPANILVLDGGRRVGYIDLGLVSCLPRKQINSLMVALEGVARNDAPIVTQAILTLCQGESAKSLASMERRVAQILAKISEKTMGSLPLGQFFKDTLLLLHRNGLHFPENLSMTISSLLTIEGVSKRIFPQANPFEHARFFVKS